MSFYNWNPSEKPAASERIPVTVLSGFLGSGKTTVLNRILSTSPPPRFAVLVNDLGEVNIDASLIQSAVKEMKGSIAGMLELRGGCICCSIQTDLLDALLELSQSFQPDHILIEATGVAEPEAILETLYSGNLFGRKGTDFLKVANMVTVVDAANLEKYLDSPLNRGNGRRAHLLPSDQRRPLQELLLEQIECADILLLNKVDTLEDTARKRFHQYLNSLNPSAQVWECTFGDIDVKKLMQDQRFREQTTLTGAAWHQAILQNQKGRQNTWSFSSPQKSDRKPTILTHTHHHHKDYGLETFVFNARQPFAEHRFLKVLRNELKGVIRAKGYYWTDRLPDRVGLLSIAGGMLRADYLSEWWHTIVQRGGTPFEQVPEIIRQSWHPLLGDRRQELVFIGVDLDRERIENALNECFVHE